MILLPNPPVGNNMFCTAGAADKSILCKFHFFFFLNIVEIQKDHSDSNTAKLKCKISTFSSNVVMQLRWDWSFLGKMGGFNITCTAKLEMLHNYFIIFTKQYIYKCLDSCLDSWLDLILMIVCGHTVLLCYSVWSAESCRWVLQCLSSISSTGILF